MPLTLIAIGLVAWIVAMFADWRRIRLGGQPTWLDVRMGNWLVLLLTINALAQELTHGR